MNDQSFRSTKDLRRQHNSDLIRRMRNGESLTSFDSKASWYPPRPIIQKDKAEMARLYDSRTDTERSASSKRLDAENVVSLSEAFPGASRRFDEGG